MYTKFNNTKHTARYQLSRFLQSEESFKLNLDTKDISLLIVIFDYMDSGYNEACYVDQIKLSKISRVARSTLIERIKKLVKYQLIIKKRIGYKNYYYIGETIKKYVQSLDILSPAIGHTKSGDWTLYNNNYNNIYKKDYAQNKYKESHLSTENQSNSYKNDNLKNFKKSKMPDELKEKIIRLKKTFVLN